MARFALSVSFIFFVAMVLSLSSKVHAKPTNTFLYQVYLPKLAPTCEQELEAWQNRFATATGLQIVSSQCHGVVEIPEHSEAVYPVSLKYRNDFPLAPYKVEIGRKDILIPVVDHQPYYVDLTSCLRDLEVQTTGFQKHTGLLPVTAFCERDRSVLGQGFFLQIEGFSRDPYSRPARRLYNFFPNFSGLPSEAQSEAILLAFDEAGIEIVKWNLNGFSYYAAAPLILDHDSLMSFRNLEQCEAQKETVREIYRRAGSVSAEVWCLPSRYADSPENYSLEVLHRGTFSLYPTPATNAQIYYRFEDCLDSRKAVLEDSRYMDFLGALCGPSYSKNGFEIFFF